MKTLFLFTVLLFSKVAFAELRFGGALGFGGAGIVSDVTINASTITVKRSESPGTLSLLIEKSLSNDMVIGLDRTTGFSLSPFSLGVYFTGVNWKWYFWNAPYSAVKSPANNSIFYSKELSPFVAPMIGVAEGTISRQNDLVSDVSASGVFWGMQAGVDYQNEPNWISRASMVFGTSLNSSYNINSKLQLFSLQYSLIYIYE